MIYCYYYIFLKWAFVGRDSFDVNDMECSLIARPYNLSVFTSFCVDLPLGQIANFSIAHISAVRQLFAPEQKWNSLFFLVTSMQNSMRVCETKMLCSRSIINFSHYCFPLNSIYKFNAFSTKFFHLPFLQSSSIKMKRNWSTSQ